MDYRSRKAAFSFTSWLIAAALFPALTVYTSLGYGLLGGSLVAAAFFMVSFLGRQSLFRRVDDALYRAALSRGSTKLLS